MEWNGIVLSMKKYDDNNDDTRTYRMDSLDITVKFTYMKFQSYTFNCYGILQGYFVSILILIYILWSLLLFAIDVSQPSAHTNISPPYNFQEYELKCVTNKFCVPKPCAKFCVLPQLVFLLKMDKKYYFMSLLLQKSDQNNKFDIFSKYSSP